MSKVALNSVLVTILNAVGQAASFVLFAGIAALFGADRQTDAFFLALTIPALFTNAVVNSIASACIPVLTECHVQRPEAEGRLLGSLLLYVFVFSLGATLLLGLFASPILGATLSGFNSSERQLAVQQTLLLLPMIALQTVFGVIAAAFNAAGRFRVPVVAIVTRFVATFALLMSRRRHEQFGGSRDAGELPNCADAVSGANSPSATVG